MSLESMYANNVQGKREEIINLKKKRTKLMKNKSDLNRKLITIRRQLENAKSLSTIKNKMNEIDRNSKKINEIDKKISICDARILKKEKEFSIEETKLLKEQTKSQNKRNRIIENSYNQLQSNMNELERNSKLIHKEIIELKTPKEEINILFLGANPDILLDNGKSTRLKLDKETREIHDSIIKSLNRDSIHFETRLAVRPSDLFQAINEVNPTIIHFSGHGAKTGEIALQDNNDDPEPIKVEAIKKMLECVNSNLRLVVFNNCFSSVLANEVSEVVEASIGMKSAVSDNAAIIFASQLYSAIGFGRSLSEAFNQAKAMLSIENTGEESTPELYINKNLKASDIYIMKNVSKSID